MAITDAVIPVAGLGTRLLPATRSQPKEMLPVVDKPVVQYVVEELVGAGIARLLFVTGRRKRAIEDHFDADPELDVEPLIDPRTGLQIFYTRQARPAGLGDAVRYGQAFASGDGTVVALGRRDHRHPAGSRSGDRPPADRGLRARSPGAALAVAEVPDEAVPRYGIAIGSPGAGRDPFELEGVVEKPDPAAVSSRTAIMGRYVLGPAVFEALRDTRPDPSGEVQLTSALAARARVGRPPDRGAARRRRAAA